MKSEKILDIKTLGLEIDVMFFDLPPYEVHQISNLGFCIEGEGEFDGPYWFV